MTFYFASVAKEFVFFVESALINRLNAMMLLIGRKYTRILKISGLKWFNINFALTVNSQLKKIKVVTI